VYGNGLHDGIGYVNYITLSTRLQKSPTAVLERIQAVLLPTMRSRGKYAFAPTFVGAHHRVPFANISSALYALVSHDQSYTTRFDLMPAPPLPMICQHFVCFGMLGKADWIAVSILRSLAGDPSTVYCTANDET
jgi:hypothetical protein